MLSLKNQLFFLGSVDRNVVTRVLDNDYFLGSFMYQSVVNAYASRFSSGNILLLSYKDLLADPDSSFMKICTFLDLPIMSSMLLPELNASSAKRQAPASFLASLHRLSLRYGFYEWIPSVVKIMIKKLFTFDVSDQQLNSICNVSIFELETLLAAIDSQSPSSIEPALFLSLIHI